MKIGILGGTRFIGFHLVEALLKKGVDVSIVHRGKTLEPRTFDARVRRFHGERGRPGSLERFFSANYDAVVDLSGYAPSQVEPLVSRWRSRIGHYIFCSTSSVYRQPPPLPADEASPRDMRAGTYGGDKTLVEDFLLAQSRRHDWPVTILRPHAVFGPEDPAQTLYLFTRLRAREPILVRPGTLDKKTNFLWVGDLVEAFIKAAGNPKAFGRTFNLAGRETHTLESFGRLLAEIAGAGKFNPLVLDGRSSARLPDLGLSWHPFDIVPRAEKAARTLEWTLTPLRDALKETWDWCRSRPERLALKRQWWEKEAAEGRAAPWWSSLRGL